MNWRRLGEGRNEKELMLGDGCQATQRDGKKLPTIGQMNTTSLFCEVQIHTASVCQHTTPAHRAEAN